MYAGGEGKDVLKRVKRMQVAPGAKSFFFKLYTGILSVRTFQADRSFYLPWGTNCLICQKPENMDHVFLHCWEGVYFWDVLQRIVQKELPLNSYGIRFLPIVDEEEMPFDLIMLCGLQCLWRAHMADFYRDQDAQPARMYFRECMVKFVELQKTQEILPEWLSRVEPLAALREF
uniref:Tick transposon n=1 Tax=Rhipicephalus microplus TaxID=6941 RepID=A0A6M2D348_RHIMP